MVTVDDVPRGDSGVICPSCKSTLIAKKGEQVLDHFAHIGRLERRGCSETALHMYAKRYLETCKGKHLRLPGFLSEPGARSDELRIDVAKAEMRFPNGIKRFADVGLRLEMRRPRNRDGNQSGGYTYGTPFSLAFEICVTNPKNGAYVVDVERSGLYALEQVITPELVKHWRLSSTTFSWEGAVKHLILNVTRGKRWLRPHPDVDSFSIPRQKNGYLEWQVWKGHGPNRKRVWTRNAR